MKTTDEEKTFIYKFLQLLDTYDKVIHREILLQMAEGFDKGCIRAGRHDFRSQLYYIYNTKFGPDPDPWMDEPLTEEEQKRVDECDNEENLEPL